MIVAPINSPKIAQAIRDRKEFRNSTGHFRSKDCLIGDETGRMPEELAAAFRRCNSIGRISYVIYSYGTPIAWVESGEWIVPDETYSQPTHRHQRMVRQSI